MPLIEVTLAEGRTPVQLRTLISALTHAAAEAVDAPVESIRVVIREVPLTHWGAGDVTLAERRYRVNEWQLVWTRAVPAAPLAPPPPR